MFNAWAIMGDHPEQLYQHSMVEVMVQSTGTGHQLGRLMKFERRFYSLEKNWHS